jgi:N-acetylglucosamine kinase-like BadF-type ATPase
VPLVIAVLFLLAGSTLTPRAVEHGPPANVRMAGAQESVSFLETRIKSALGDLTITADGANAIRAAVAAASGRYASDRRREAEANADRLAQRIRTRAGEGSGTVTAGVVTTSLRDLCPLWPFCD